MRIDIPPFTHLHRRSPFSCEMQCLKGYSLCWLFWIENEEEGTNIPLFSISQKTQCHIVCGLALYVSMRTVTGLCCANCMNITPCVHFHSSMLYTVLVVFTGRVENRRERWRCYCHTQNWMITNAVTPMQEKVFVHLGITVQHIYIFSLSSWRSCWCGCRSLNRWVWLQGFLIVCCRIRWPTCGICDDYIRQH